MRVFFLSVVTALCCLAASGRESWTMPPASSGVINGRTALLVWPANGSGLADPSNCFAHMVPYDHQDDELLFPCGVWFQPPVGKYRYWLEKDERFISPYPTIVFYAGAHFEGSSLRIAMPVSPGGQVALRNRHESGQSFRLLHIPPPSDHPASHRSMDRRAPADAIRPLLMPEGIVVAGLFDSKSGDADALSRPIQVTRDRLTYVDPQPPKNGADVLAVLERQGIRKPDAPADAALSLRIENVERPPDVVSDTATRIVAVWYGVSGRTAELRIRSRYESLPPVSLRLVPGRVITIRKLLGPLPAATASIHAPSEVGR